jgi:hypothetical protein
VRRALPPCLSLCLLLVACAPLTVEQAERACLQSARLAEQPRGEVGIGVTSEGRTEGVFDITVSSDFLLGRDPNEVYQRCVLQRSGQLPSRPYYSLPQ